jgi:hypothetical protein
VLDGSITRATAKGANSGKSAFSSGSIVVLLAGTLITARQEICVTCPPPQIGDQR